MSVDVFKINASQPIQNGLVVCQPMPGQVGLAGPTNQGSGGFVLSYRTATPEDRVQLVSSVTTAEGQASDRYFVSEELRRARHGAATPSQYNATTTAGLLLAANPGRISAQIANNGANTLFIGSTAALAKASGIPVPSGQKFEDDFGVSDWYGATSTGTADVRILEIS